MTQRPDAIHREDLLFVTELQGLRTEQGNHPSLKIGSPNLTCHNPRGAEGWDTNKPTSASGWESGSERRVENELRPGLLGADLTG